MPEWQLEHGIGEDRAILLGGDHILASRTAWPGELANGLVSDAVLISRTQGSQRGTARFPSGEEALVSGLPRDAVEGAPIRLVITRPAMGETRRRKRALARPSASALHPAPTLAEQLAAEGHQVRVVPTFSAGDYDELVAEAFAAEVSFAGGTLLFSPTPAMLLIDVDGVLAPTALAIAAAKAVGAALRRFDCGGAIGIDFPTLVTKADRQVVDTALAASLADWPHERTAMNGFGFVQLVARLARPSLLHRAAFDPAGLAVRMLMRRAERLTGAGAIELAGHPNLEPCLTAEWRGELARRTGREIRWRSDPRLALTAPHAQIVAR